MEEKNRVDIGDVGIDSEVAEIQNNNRGLNTDEAENINRLKELGGLVSNTLPAVEKSNAGLVKSFDDGAFKSDGLDIKDISDGINDNSEQKKVDAEKEYKQFAGEPIDIKEKVEDSGLTSFYKAVKNAGPLTVTGFRDMTNSLSRALLAKDTFSDELPEKYQPKTKSDKFVSKFVPFIAGVLMTDKALGLAGAAAVKAGGRAVGAFINSPKWTKGAGKVLKLATDAGIAEGIFGIPSEEAMDKFLSENSEYKELFEGGKLTKEEVYGTKEFKESDWEARTHNALVTAGWTAGFEATAVPLLKSAMRFYRDTKARGVLKQGAEEAYSVAKNFMDSAAKITKERRAIVDNFMGSATEATIDKIERLVNDIGESRGQIRSLAFEGGEGGSSPLNAGRAGGKKGNLFSESVEKAEKEVRSLASEGKKGELSPESIAKAKEQIGEKAFSENIEKAGEQIRKITEETADISDIGFKSVDLLDEQFTQMTSMLKDKGVRAMILDGHTETIDNVFDALRSCNEANRQNTLLLSRSTGARVLGKKGALSLTKLHQDLNTYAGAIDKALAKKAPKKSPAPRLSDAIDEALTKDRVPDSTKSPARDAIDEALDGQSPGRKDYQFLGRRGNEFLGRKDGQFVGRKDGQTNSLDSLLDAIAKNDVSGEVKRDIVEGFAKLTELDGDTDGFLKAVVSKSGAFEKIKESLGTAYKFSLISSPRTPMNAFMGNMAASFTNSMDSFNQKVISKYMPKFGSSSPIKYATRIEEELAAMGMSSANPDAVRVATRTIDKQYQKNSQLVLNEFEKGNPFLEAYVGITSRMSSILNGLSLSTRALSGKARKGKGYFEYMRDRALTSGSAKSGKYGDSASLSKYTDVNRLVDASQDSSLGFMKRASNGLKNVAKFQMGVMEFADNVTRSQLESTLINQFASRRVTSSSLSNIALEKTKANFFNDTEQKLLDFLITDTGDKVTMQSNEVGAIGELVKKARKALNGALPLIPLGDLLVPFMRTMSNSFMFVADHLPIASLFLKRNQEAIKAGGQAAENVFGKMATGLQLTALGLYMHKSGLVSAPYSPSARRRANIAQGIPDSSFIVNTKDGGIAVPMTSWSPISFFTTLPAMFSEVMSGYKADELDTDTKNHAISAMLHASLVMGGEMFGELGLQRIGELTESIVGLDSKASSFKRLTNSLERFGISVASSVVPAGVGYVAKNFINPENPDALSYPTTVMEAIRNKLGTGIPLYNMFGERIKAKKTALGGFLPVEYSNVAKDPLMQEMVAIGLQIKSPSRFLQNPRYGSIKMNQEQYMDYVENYYKPLDLRKYVEKRINSALPSVWTNTKNLKRFKRDLQASMSRKVSRARNDFILKNPELHSRFAERDTTNTQYNASAYSNSFKSANNP